MFELSSAQTELKLRARAFAEAEAGPLAAEVDRSEAYPWETVEKLAKAGFMGMTIPKSWPC